MRKLLFTFLIIFSFSLTFSQTIDYKYFNKKWKPTTEKRAKYIRKIEKINDTLYKVTDLDKFKKVLMNGEYSSITPMIENGYFEFFDFYNYKKTATGYYKTGKMVGDWHFTDSETRKKRIVNYDIVLIKTETEKEKLTQSDSLTFVVVESMPKFRNGHIQKFSTYIGENLVYPPMAQKNLIDGTVFLQFDIDTKGQVCNIEIVRKVNKDLEREAIRVVSQSDNWSPGMQKGEAVKVRFTFPIVFFLK